MMDLAATLLLMAVILVFLLLLGALHYFAAMATDPQVQKRRMVSLEPLTQYRLLSELEAYCLGKVDLDRIRKLARATRRSMIAVWVVSVPVLLVVWV